MRRPAAVLTVAALALVLGGCPPPSYGVSREFDVARLPDADCIKSTIPRIPEVKDFQYRPDDDRKNIFGEPTDDKGHLVYWTGRREDGLVEMSFASSSHHPSFVEHHSMNRDRQTARISAETVRTIMLKIESQLAAHCRMAIVSNVDEKLP